MGPAPHLVLAVVLLGVAQHAVAEPADVPEGGVSLVPQLLQPQHGPVPAVRERGLKELEDLRIKGPRRRGDERPHPLTPTNGAAPTQRLHW